MPHILVVEDEEHIAVLIQFNLEAEGYRVTTAGAGPAALEVVDAQPDDVDLVVLDLMLPGMSGYAVCEALRERGHDMPVLMLTARTLSEDRARGFDVGANQYMMKPFDLPEFLSRIKNLLAFQRVRRERTPKPALRGEKYEFARARIDFASHEVSVGGETKKVTPLELKLLRYLVEREGKVVPRQELLEQVWEMPGHLSTRAPDQFIRRLRLMFEDDPAAPRHFLTIRDAGYRFVATPQNKDSPEAAS